MEEEGEGGNKCADSGCFLVIECSQEGICLYCLLEEPEA